MRERPSVNHHEPVLDRAPVEAAFGPAGAQGWARFEIEAWRLARDEDVLIYAPAGATWVGPAYRPWAREAWPPLPDRVVFRGSWIARPRWLTPAVAAFWHPTIQSEDRAERLTTFRFSGAGERNHPVSTDRGRAVFTWRLPGWDRLKLYPFDDDGIAAYLASLNASVLYERHRRGFPALSGTGGTNWSSLTRDGMPVVEVVQRAGAPDVVTLPDVIQPMPSVDEATFDKNYRGPTPRALRREPANASPTEHLWELAMTERPVRAPLPANAFAPLSTEHGAAQFAWSDDLQRAPSLACAPAGEGAPDGCLLGRFDPAAWQAGAGPPFHVFARGEGHRLIVGPPGSGKFTAVIAPLLLLNDAASAFVFDVADGEAARLTARWRRNLGPVMALDPFGVSGLASGGLNPLDLLDVADPDLLQKAKRLADALFVADNAGQNAEYFNNQALDVLAALLLHLVSAPGETRTLRRLREIVRRPFGAALLAAMEANPIAGGVVADTAANLIHAVESGVESNTFYVLQTLRANTDFLDLPAVQRVTAQTTLDPRKLRETVSTLYVCLPEHELQPVSRWLRLVYTTVMENVRTRGGVPLNVILDEFPSLGRFPRVQGDMAQTRKFGVHYHVAVQSLAQLEALYDRGWQAFLGASRFQQLLGANDHMTADYFSKRLGRTTRPGTSTSQNRTAGGGSAGATEGWVGLDLMAPDELGRLPPGETIIVVEGEKPLRLGKVPWWACAANRATPPVRTV